MIMSCGTAMHAGHLNSTNRPGEDAAVAFIFIFQVFFSCFLDITGFIYTSEVFPAHLCAQGVAIGQMTNEVTTIMWLQAVPSVFDSIGW